VVTDVRNGSIATELGSRADVRLSPNSGGIADISALRVVPTTEVATLTRSPCNDPEGRTCYKITPVLRHAAIRDALRKWFDHRIW